ncbi:MAG: RNA polymerase sigma factor [Cytophagaceae bacterium]
MVHYSDEEMIAGLTAGSESALSSLYKSYFPMILNFIQNNSGSYDEAKDVYQEAVILFYEKVREGRLELSCRIKTYLYSVCRRLWLKRLSEKSRYSGGIEDSEKFIAIENEEKAEEDYENNFIHMKAAVDQLGEPCKSIIQDFYIHELSMEEIADKFGYTSSDNAKNQKYKCLQRLKKLFFNKAR